jgi:hypothetical protein
MHLILSIVLGVIVRSGAVNSDRQSPVVSAEVQP